MKIIRLVAALTLRHFFVGIRIVILVILIGVAFAFARKNSEACNERQTNSEGDLPGLICILARDCEIFERDLRLRCCSVARPVAR